MKRNIFALIFILILICLFFSLNVCAKEFYISYDKALENGDLYGYLEKLLSEVEPGELYSDDIEDISEYIEFAAERAGFIEISAEENVFSVNGNEINESYLAGKNTAERFMNLLAEKGITLNRDIEITSVVFINGFHTESYADILADFENLSAMSEIGRVKFVFGPKKEYISISGEDIRIICQEEKYFRIQIEELSGTYTVRFLDNYNAIIPKYSVSAKIGFPAESADSTVYLFYDHKQENWGGQYNTAEGLIEVMTKYSGEYSVSKPDIDISDIDELSDYEKQAIYFMTVRDYFALDGNKFRPYAMLSRYDFTEALVRIFFVLDDEAECTFPDVNDEYYRYVAASQEASIVEGFEDGTFRGDSGVTVQQVIALAARTINEKNGYSYPSNIKAYTGSLPAGSIDEWAEKEFALAAREGIFTAQPGVNLKAEISRKDAAVALYRLFMIMNNTPRYSVLGNIQNVLNTKHETFWTIRNGAIIISLIILADAAAAAGLIVIIKKYRKEGQSH